MKILVLSYTRCGSTALCKWLSKELSYTLDETPYDRNHFNRVFEKNNIIRKIVVEEYFPTKEEINKFNKVIFLTRKNNIDAAISRITADNSGEWHSEYEVTNEWINENRTKITSISNYINRLKIKLEYYEGFHIMYEDVYENKESIIKILDYINIHNPKHLEDLNYKNRYRKDDNVFVKDKQTKLI
jgi:LPS sulfotransferase NodH